MANCFDKITHTLRFEGKCVKTERKYFFGHSYLRTTVNCTSDTHPTNGARAKSFSRNNYVIG